MHHRVVIVTSTASRQTACTGERDCSSEKIRTTVGPRGPPSNADPADVALVVPFTEREAEVLRCLTEGLSNSEIATRLYIGHVTVKSHLKYICIRIGARDRTQAVVWAYQTGFVAR